MPTKAKTSSKAKSSQPSDDPYAGVTREEKRFVESLLKKIELAQKREHDFNTITLPRLRKLAAGDKTGNGVNQTRTNMIYATAATLLPLVYAKNPEIGVTLTEAVSRDEYDQWRGFSKTAQSLLNRCFIQEPKLKPYAKANVRSAMLTGVGWLKMIWQESLAGDPILVRRENDMQDNLRQIEYLMACSGRTDVKDYEAKAEELRIAIKGLRESPEAKIYKGFAFDRVKTENMLILDDSVVEFHDYSKAKMLDHIIYMDDDEFKATFGFKPPVDTKEFAEPTNTQKGGTPNADGKTVFREIHEIWDRAHNTVYTVAAGCHRYLRQPYVPKGMPERWHGFYCIGFNLLEGRWRPLSDVELLEHLQAEYNETRYLYAEARKEAIPVWVFRKSGNLTEEDVEKLVNRKARQWIGIEGNPQVPLKDDVMQMEGIKLDPAAYDVSIIRADMDMMVGMSDASRANLVEAKTATEAEIMRQALQNRVAERQDANEDMITEMAQAALEIMLQKLSYAEVCEIVGNEATWPMTAEEWNAHNSQPEGMLPGQTLLPPEGQEQAPAPKAPKRNPMQPMTIDEIFNKIHVGVRAGSTGKPNLAKERESWATLMGVINETTDAVAKLRMEGAFELAESKIQLLRETLRRYDEKIDVDLFIPPQEVGEDGKPVAMTNALMQAQQTQEQLQAAMQQLEQTKAALQAAEQKALLLEQQLGAEKTRNDLAIEQARADAANAETDRIRIAQEEETKRVEAEAKARAEADAEVQKEAIRAEQESRHHEREMMRDTHAALLGAAKDIITTEMTLVANAMTAPVEGEEGEPAKKPKVDAAEMMRKLDVVIGILDETVPQPDYAGI